MTCCLVKTENEEHLSLHEKSLYFVDWHLLREYIHPNWLQLSLWRTFCFLHDETREGVTPHRRRQDWLRNDNCSFISIYLISQSLNFLFLIDVFDIFCRSISNYFEVCRFCHKSYWCSLLTLPMVKSLPETIFFNRIITPSFRETCISIWHILAHSFVFDSSATLPFMTTAPSSHLCFLMAILLCSFHFPIKDMPFLSH